MRRKGRHRAWVSGLQEGKCLLIAFRYGLVASPDLKWLESPDRLGSAAQDQVTDRSAAKVLHPIGESCTDQNAGAKLLIGDLQPRRHVNGVAISRIVEETASAEIADDCGPGMSSDACNPHSNTLLLPAFAE